jgi:predicted glycoside hydrolase/deacetylase ChbG (UPF0249 family)
MTMAAERLLIVNADDYNTDPERNRGIIEAAKNGILTSASVLTNMPGLDGALGELEQVLGPRIGVHLNLTRGKPLSPDVQSLTGLQGDFLPKGFAWRKSLCRGYSVDDIRREWSAQIEAFCTNGRKPDHLDGNNHLHIFPGCARICAELARRFNIRSVRLPLEPLHVPGLCGRSGLKRLFLALLAVRARSIFGESGLCMPDRMFGIAFPDTGDIASLCCFLKKLPAGVSELMCHPGYPSAGAQSFSSAQRERELRALTSTLVREAIIGEDIRLISFNDMG